MKPAMVFLLALGVCGQARADRDIVFSAQFYRWSGRYYADELSLAREQTLDDKGPAHLYRINPDGSGLQPLTSGRWDDQFPHWSPDGQRVLFLRLKDGESSGDLCMVAANGGVVRRVAGAKGLGDQALTLAWSRDNRHVAYYDRAARAVVVLDTATGCKRSIRGAYAFAWSPDGKRLCLTSSPSQEGEDRRQRSSIYSLSAGKAVPLPRAVLWPCWLPDGTIVGFPPGKLDVLIRLRSDGKTIGKTSLHYTEHDAPEIGLPGRWGITRAHKARALFLVVYGMSDGHHYSTALLDLKTGRFRTVSGGAGAALSPDAGTVLVSSDDDWIGPYKRGGRRGGSLALLIGAGLQRKQLTTDLMRCYGADWRK